jgi:HEAT repeat protein
MPAGDRAADSLMYHDPELPGPRVNNRLPPRLPALWLEALERPEADLKCQAAQAIALANERGISGMQVAIEPLVRELRRSDQHANVRVAVARALIVLDAKDSATDLARAATAEPELRELVDPALARWDYKPARAQWLERLDQAPPKHDTVLAIRSLAAVRDGPAAGRLRVLALDRKVPAAIRLEAARALGVIRLTGSEDDSRRLAGDSSTQGRTDRLVAASLLRNHRGDEAVRLLQSLARDTEPAVASIALDRLIELDSGLVLPLLDFVLGSEDANLRRIGVNVLYRHPTDAHVRLLSDRLSDSHPNVRTQARERLRELAAKAEWQATVIREGSRMIAGTDWRGLEQAIILLGELDHKPAAGQMVNLLSHDRPEVFTTAAWGLRRLAVQETLSPALKYFDSQYKKMFASGAAAGRPNAFAGDVDRQLSHLAQFLGQSRSREADELLRRLIPPTTEKGNPAGPELRAAAIWALGMIHEGKQVPELVRALSGRLAAVGPFDLEDNRVRRMSAVALGRMKATEGLRTLREFYIARKPSLDSVNNACGWAIERITGEKMPAPGTVDVIKLGWFLLPSD